MKNFLILAISFTSFAIFSQTNNKYNEELLFEDLSNYNLAALNGGVNRPHVADSHIRRAIEECLRQETECRLGANVLRYTTLYHFENLNLPQSYKIFRGSDTQGSIYSKEDVYFKNYSVGHSLSPRDIKVTSAGTINILKDENQDLPHTFGMTDIFGGKNRVKRIDADGFAAQHKWLQDLSKDLYELPSTGIAHVPPHEGWYLRLEGDGKSEVQVFHVDANLLRPANMGGLRAVNIPKTSTLVINFYNLDNEINLTDFHGEISTSYNNKDHSSLDKNYHPRAQTLFNFYRPDTHCLDHTVHLRLLEIRGTVISPNANILFSTGLIRGQVMTCEFTGSGQINWHDRYKTKKPDRFDDNGTLARFLNSRRQ